MLMKQFQEKLIQSKSAIFSKNDLQPFSWEQVERYFSKSENGYFYNKQGLVEIANNGLGRWSFICISAGNRDLNLKKFIESVDMQSIPEYEILIIGKVDNPLEFRKFKRVTFHLENTDYWITGKKNIGIKNAKYENLMILHDRFYLSQNWYKSILESGPYLYGSIRQYTGHRRIADWVEHIGSRYSRNSFTRRLPDERVSWWTYVSGGIGIFKKALLEKYPYDENLFWNEMEDVELSRRIRDDSGILPKLINAHVEAISTRWVDPTSIGYCIRMLKAKLKGSQIE